MGSDDTSIGAILMAMGAVTEEDLVSAVEDQQKLREDALLGKILVANGSCTAKQLKIAISAQEGMRSGDKSDQAIAIADLALSRRRRKSLVNMQTRLSEKSFSIVKKITRDDHKAITPSMLAENGK